MTAESGSAEPVAALAHFPFPPGPLGGEPRQYAERRMACPLSKVKLRTGHEATLILGYRDVAAALSDDRLSRVLTDPGAPRWTRASNIFTDAVSLVNQEGPEHLRQRRVIGSALTASRIDSWIPLIQETADALLNAVQEMGPGTDLMENFFAPYPVHIICRLLGIPLADYPRFRGWSNAFMSASPRTEEQRMADMASFAEYARELITRKRARPGDDILDSLIAAHDDGERLSEDELIYIILGMIAAGTDTVTNILSRIIVMLLREQRKLWETVARNGEITRSVVNELLRYVQQGNGAMVRVAREDIELPSGTVRSGETVLLPLSSTGLDETVFPEPHALRFDRGGPRSLIFSGGPHYCPGVNLAKAELQCGLQTLMSRLPGMHLTVDPARLRFTKGELLTVLKTVPVHW